MSCDRNLIAEMSAILERKHQLELEIMRLLLVAKMFERDHLRDKQEPPPIGTLRRWFDGLITSLSAFAESRWHAE